MSRWPSRQNRFCRVVSVCACAAALSLAGCDGGCSKKTTGASGSSSAPAVRPPGSQPWHATLQAGGATGSIFRALQSLTLNEEQHAQLSAVGVELVASAKQAAGQDADAGALRDQLKALHTRLIEDVKKGKVDLDQVTRTEAQLAQADELRHRRESEALNRVQRILTTDERSAVATSVRKAGALPRTRDAGVAVHAEAGAARAASAARRVDGGAPRHEEVNWARKRLESYMAGITLDAAQDAKLQAILDAEGKGADTRDADAEQTAMLLDAFEKDGFDANRFRFGDPQDGRAPFFRLARFVAKVMPLLTPEQQSKLAGNLVESDAPAPRRRHGKPGAAP